MRISDWSSDVCSSDLIGAARCRKHDIAHHAFGLKTGRLGNPDQQSLFAVNPPDFGHERLEHPVASPAADLVGNSDQQVDQPVVEFGFPLGPEKPEHIGRTAWWERVCQYVEIAGVAGAVK